MEQNYGPSDTTGTTTPTRRSNRINWRSIGIFAAVAAVGGLLIVFVAIPVGNDLDRWLTNFSNEHLCDTTFAVNGEVREGTEVITGTDRVVSFRRDGYTEQYEQRLTGGPVTYTTIVDDVERRRYDVPGHNAMPRVVEDCKS